MQTNDMSYGSQGRLSVLLGFSFLGARGKKLEPDLKFWNPQLRHKLLMFVTSHTKMCKCWTNKCWINWFRWELNNILHIICDQKDAQHGRDVRTIIILQKICIVLIDHNVKYTYDYCITYWQHQMTVTVHTLHIFIKIIPSQC